MENSITNQIRHIGYHNASKSQVNILSSPKRISIPNINENNNYNNQRKEKFKNLFSIFDKTIMFLKINTSSNNNKPFDILIKENNKLKTINSKLKDQIKSYENNYNDSFEGEFINQKSVKQYQRKINFEKEKNKKLKYKNIQLKKKLKLIQEKSKKYFPHAQLFTHKKEIISLMQKLSFNMSNFFSILNDSIEEINIKNNINNKYSHTNYIENERLDNDNSSNLNIKFTECENLCVSKDDFDENNKIIIPLKEFDKVKNEKNKNKNDKSNINNQINNTNRTTRTEGRKNNIFNINKGINESNGITYVTNRTSSNIRNRNLKSKEQNGRITNKSNKSNGKVYKRTTV